MYRSPVNKTAPNAACACAGCPGWKELIVRRPFVPPRHRDRIAPADAKGAWRISEKPSCGAMDELMRDDRSGLAGYKGHDCDDQDRVALLEYVPMSP